MTEEIYSNELLFLTVTEVAKCLRVSKSLFYTTKA